MRTTLNWLTTYALVTNSFYNTEIYALRIISFTQKIVKFQKSNDDKIVTLEIIPTDWDSAYPSGNGFWRVFEL